MGQTVMFVLGATLVTLVLVLAGVIGWAFGAGPDLEDRGVLKVALWKLWVLFAGVLLVVVCLMELALLLVVG